MLSSDKFLYYNLYMVTLLCNIYLIIMYIYHIFVTRLYFICSRLARNCTFLCQNLYSY